MELKPHIQKETDPDGLDPKTFGAKLDNGKPRPHMVLGGFSNALLEVAKVGTYGVTKYTDRSWVGVKDGVNRYQDAMLRHYLEIANSEYDEETGLLHLAHLAWNALAALELFILNEDA